MESSSLFFSMRQMRSNKAHAAGPNVRCVRIWPLIRGVRRMNTKCPSILDISKHLIGLPCWNVHQGYGSFLTFEFGNPEYFEPLVTNIEPESLGSNPGQLTNNARGEWHLWIYCCAWFVSQGGNKIAYGDSNHEEIKLACNALEGQSLRDIKIGDNPGFTEFLFDHGGALSTSPYDDELNEHWMLFCPDGKVFTYRSDGAVSYESGNTEEGKEHWFPGA